MLSGGTGRPGQTDAGGPTVKEGDIVALVEVSIVPVGTNQASFSSFVTEAARVAEQMGLKFQVTPTATVLEGDLQQALNCAQKMHAAAVRAGASRVVTNVTIDDRQDKALTMESAVDAVTQQLG